jgi:hypothetical protein
VQRFEGSCCVYRASSPFPSFYKKNIILMSIGLFEKREKKEDNLSQLDSRKINKIVC